MVVRKKVGNLDHKKERNEEEHNITEKYDNKSNNIKEEISRKKTWTWKRILLNICKALGLIIVLPAFLNFSALIHEEKQLRPEGLSISILFYYLLCTLPKMCHSSTVDIIY